MHLFLLKAKKTEEIFVKCEMWASIFEPWDLGSQTRSRISGRKLCQFSVNAFAVTKCQMKSLQCKSLLRETRWRDKGGLPAITLIDEIDERLSQSDDRSDRLINCLKARPKPKQNETKLSPTHSTLQEKKTCTNFAADRRDHSFPLPLAVWLMEISYLWQIRRTNRTPIHTIPTWPVSNVAHEFAISSFVCSLPSVCVWELLMELQVVIAWLWSRNYIFLIFKIHITTA